MNTSSNSPSRLHLLTPLAALLVVAAGHQAANAQASDPNPYYIGVSQSFTRDSNLGRVPSNFAKSSEMFSSTGLNAGINQPFGRQRLRIDGNVTSNRYSDSSALNNTGYGLNAALDWSTIERLSGTLGYTNSQSLASFFSPLTPLGTERNVKTTEELSAKFLLGGVTILSFTGELSHRKLGNSAPAYLNQAYNQNAGSLGIRYRVSGALDAGVALRMTRGNYPNYQAIPGGFLEDDLNRRDIDLTASWVPSGLTTISTRVSLGKQTHSVAAVRDFSGVTGSISVQHKPAGRLSYSGSISRDTGTENSFITQLGPRGVRIESLSDNSQISTSAQLTANYEITAKIQANATARMLTSEVGISGLPSSGTNTTTGIDLGLSYAPFRNLVIGATLGFEQRNTTSTLSSGYRTNTMGVSAKYTLQ
jgi:hypothetical protein